MARVWAQPNFERTGVVSGFVLAPGAGLFPTLSAGVLFAQGAMWRPAAPAAPAAPANQLSHLFYNSVAGLYWKATRTPNAADDAYIGWARCNADAVTATCAQVIGTSGEMEPLTMPEPLAQEPTANPSDAVPTVRVSANTTLEPIAQIVEIDTSNGPVAVTFSPFEQWIGLDITLVKVTGDANAGTGLAAAGETFNGVGSKTLTEQWESITVRAVAAGEGVIVASATANTSVPETPPAAPVSVSAHEGPVSERYRTDPDNLTYTNIHVEVTLSGGSDAQWVTLWATNYDGTGWDWIGKFTPAAEIKFARLVPAGGANWKVRATTGKSAADNAPSTAVESAPFAVAGHTAVGDTAIADATVGALENMATPDGTQYWGVPYVRWTNPADPNFFHSRLTVQLVDDAGNPAPTAEGAERTVDESTAAGTLFVTHQVQWWNYPAADSTYRRFRFRLYAVTRSGQTTLCKAWPGGADYYDVIPVAGEGSIDPTRLKRSKLGAGLTNTGSEFRVALGYGLTADGAGNIKSAAGNAANMLMNPSFEDADAAGIPLQWTAAYGGVTVLTGPGAVAGNRRLCVTCGAYRELFQVFPVRPHERYYWELYASKTAGADGSVDARWHFLDSANAAIGVGVGEYSPGDGWIKASGTFETPDGCVAVRFYPVTLNGSVAASSEFYVVDAVYVSKVAMAADIGYDTATFGPGVSGELTQVAVDLSKPKAGTYDQSVFDPQTGLFKLKISSQFKTSGNQLEIDQIDCNVLKSGNVYVGVGPSGGAAPTGVFAYKWTGSVYQLQAWMGQNGAVVGGWFRELYVGQNGPADAPFYMNASGVLGITNPQITLNRVDPGSGTTNTVIISTATYDALYSGALGVVVKRTGGVITEPYCWHVSRGLVIHSGAFPYNQIGAFVAVWNPVNNLFHGEAVLYGEGGSPEMIHLNGADGSIQCHFLNMVYSGFLSFSSTPIEAMGAQVLRGFIPLSLNGQTYKLAVYQ